MGMALYRKYRTTSLADTLGQEHITTTLDNALRNGNVSHAYLFTGPRGVGKTSVARILAHEVNKLPYTDDSNHLDIIEIDAASNRRIDEIRELRERVHTAPTSATYKVYIIDEVHMLTKEAFNALLKTLEEPPKHVIFILATTEFHKLPETIVSRTQHFSFKPYEPHIIRDRLRFIADSEHIDITDEALELLARAGGGSFRDSISLLDQASNSDSTIDENEARRLLGIVPEDSVAQLLGALTRSDPKETVHIIRLLRSSGFQSAQIAKQIVAVLRESYVAGESTYIHLHSLASDLLTVPSFFDPDTKLELLLLGHALSSSERPVNLSNQPQPQKPNPDPPAQATPTTTHSKTKAPEQSSATKEINPPGSTPQHSLPDKSISWWSDVLSAIKKKHNTIYSVARMAQPEANETTLKLYFAFPFHQKRINEAKNKQIISDITETVTGKSFSIQCLLKKDLAVPPPVSEMSSHTTQSEPEPDLSTIKNIFGDAELLNE